MKLDLNLYNNDVYDYIISHQEKLKYKEGLFVEYIVNPNCICLEAKVIIIRNNGLFFQPIEVFNQVNQIFNRKYNPNYTFERFLNYIKNNPNLIRNISYISLPITKLLGIENFDINEYINLCLLVKQNIVNSDLINEYETQINTAHIKDVLDNYFIAKIILKNERIEDLYTINMTDEYARGMLLYYNKLHNKENVLKIKKLVKRFCDE